MGTLNEDLIAIKNVEDTLIANKVARFSYTDTAYAENDADGVDTFNINNEQNIPNPTTSVLKVNSTVLDRGYRAQASSITRMLVNHFFGRVSYNLNKINDNMSSLIATLRAHAGTANGFATLDANGKLTRSELPRSDIAVNDTDILFTAKGAFDYTLGSITANSWLGKVFGHLFGRSWARSITSIGSSSRAYYANGLWVGCTGNKGLWWSEDGKNWTQSTGDITTYGFATVYYANGLWVAGSNDGHGSWWSEDGKNWTQGTGDITIYGFTTVYYGNGLWVAGNKGLWWSEDGKNWTQGTGDITTHSFTAVYYANGLWVACGNISGLWWSEDGKNWTRGLAVSRTFFSVYYANGLWVACGDFGYGLYWSEDGKNWTQGSGQSSGTSGTYPSRSVYHADGLWVAGIADGLMWSEDGKAWTQCSIPPSTYSTQYYTVRYANGVWITGGYTSAGLKWSEDGKNWKNAKLPASTSGVTTMNVYYANGIWIASGSYGFLWSNIEQVVEEGLLTD